jgi:hypothetical protein
MKPIFFLSPPAKRSLVITSFSVLQKVVRIPLFTLSLETSITKKYVGGWGALAQ